MMINSLARDEGPSIYYEDGLRNVLEDHLTYLRFHKESTIHTIDPMQAFRYEHDFFALLLDIGVPVHLHWLTMRMNKLICPTESSRELKAIVVPGPTVVDKIRQSHMASRRIN